MTDFKAPQPEALYLVHAGGDAYQAEIVPESKLDKAYLLTQWCTLDPAHMEAHDEALAHFHDDDQWTHEEVTGKGRRLKFSLSLEDGWIEVVRLPDTAQAALAIPAPEGGPAAGLLHEFDQLLQSAERAERYLASTPLPVASDVYSALSHACDQGRRVVAEAMALAAAQCAAEGDERAAFESWLTTDSFLGKVKRATDRDCYADGDYDHAAVNAAWHAWQARATASVKGLSKSQPLELNLRSLASNPEVAIRVYGADWAGWCAASALDALAASKVQPKGTEPATGDSTLTDLEHNLRHLHGVYSDGGARRITPEGLRQSVETNGFSKPYWFPSLTHKLPSGARAYCSCCGSPQSEVLHWNLLALCRDCVCSAFPEGPALGADADLRDRLAEQMQAKAENDQRRGALQPVSYYVRSALIHAGLPSPAPAPVIVAPDASADEMNRLHGEAYGIDWVYPEQPQEKPRALTEERAEELIEALSDWSGYVVEDTAPETLERHIRRVLAEHCITQTKEPANGR